MSYDLWFWNQADGVTKKPGEIVLELSEAGADGQETEVSGLIPLEIEGLIRRIIEEFPEIEQHRNPETGELRQLILDPAETDWVLLVEWEDTYFQLESHSAPGSILNQFIDIGLEFGCRLYDPQTGTRYDD